MNQKTRENAGNSTAKAADQIQKPASNGAATTRPDKLSSVNGSVRSDVQTSTAKPSYGASSFSKPDPKETAQEAVHQVTPKKGAIKQPYMPTPAEDADSSPLHAAKGDDDIMSKQQSQSMPSTDQIKGKWKQQVGAAKIAWGKLTEDELLRLEGHEQKLAGLVQERYAITRDEADQQVKAFFDKHKVLQ